MASSTSKVVESECPLLRTPLLQKPKSNDWTAFFIGTRQDESAIANGKVFPKDILGERAVEFALNEGRDTTMRLVHHAATSKLRIVVDESQAAKLPWPRSVLLRLHRRSNHPVDRL